MAGKVSSDPNIFLLPDIGEGLQEAEVIKWLVKEGDAVEEQQSLAEVETDKALTEIPSPRAGVIKTLHGKDGDVMKVGEPFVSYEGGEGSAAQQPTPQPDKTKKQPPKKGDPTPAENNGSAAREDDGTVVGKMSADTPGLTRQEGKALATPAVRRKAREMGIDINAVPGSGIGGRVLEKDLKAFEQSGGGSGGTTQKPATSPSATPDAGTTRKPMPRPQAQPQQQFQQQPMPQYQPQPQQQMGYGMPQQQMGMPYGMPMMMMPVPMMMPFPGMYPGMGGMGGGVPMAPGYVPASVRPIPDPAQQSKAVSGNASTAFRGVRRTIASKLRESVDTAVHFTVMDEADVTDLDALRRQFAEAGTKLSFLPFVAAAVCRAIAPRAGGRFGALNARVEGSGESQEIVEHHAVHLGIATDTDAGLMVPVIKNADALDVASMAGAIANAANGARTRSAAREDLSGSTFTISNVGSHAGMFATPVINAPEVGILAVGKVYDAVVVRDGQAVVGKKMPLSLACDHRVVDGATAALCLAEIVKLLQEPGSIA
ncbi:MAG: dihydrolipoamide acetyltransferase family protein [Phycisphaerales bacterium]|jgi:pyruvate dehydrogenase E2 component (dihydrolipoamide acetyltransferase)